MSNKLPLNAKIAAYHEAGHIIFAYFVQWSVKKVELTMNNNEIKNAITSYDFKDDETMVKSLTNEVQLNELTLEEKGKLYGIIHKRCASLLGGPIAEALFINGVNSQDKLPIDLRGPDFLNSHNIESIMMQIFKEDELVKKSLNEYILLAKTQIFWKSITLIAEEILSKESFVLNQQDIELTLNKTGFLDYANKFNS